MQAGEVTGNCSATALIMLLMKLALTVFVTKYCFWLLWWLCLSVNFFLLLVALFSNVFGKRFSIRFIYVFYLWTLDWINRWVCSSIRIAAPSVSPLTLNCIKIWRFYEVLKTFYLTIDYTNKNTNIYDIYLLIS